MDKKFRVAKDPARAHLSGGIFELRLAGLMSARLRAERRRHPNLNLRFLIATNMDGANPFDDIVLHLVWEDNGRQRTVTYFVQLKHAEKVDKPVNVHDLTAEKISKKNKDFNLRKYFKFYKQLKDIASTPMEEQQGNKRLLQEWAQGDCRFVLFTTREVLPKSKEKRSTSSLDFPFEDVFLTEQGQAFSFGETDEEVWNMLEGSSDKDTFQNEFLPRLRIFSAQAQVSALEPLLARGLQEVLDGSPPRAEQLLSNYSTFLHRWWESDDGACLSEETTEIEELIKDDINASLQQLNFRSEYHDILAERLQGYQATFIVIPGIPPDLRCSEIVAVLAKTHFQQYVVLRDTTLKEYSHEVLCVLCDKLCDEVVLCTDELNKGLISFVDKIISRKEVNVRVISSKWDSGLYTFMCSRFSQCNAWSERWTVDCLQLEEQRKILERPVCFQGHEMTLAELEESWPRLRRVTGGAALGALATGHTLSLGSPLESVDRQYVSRTVQHSISVRPSVLQMRSPQDHFLLSGFPDQILRELRHPDSPWQECSLNGVPIARENEQPSSLTSESEIICKTKWTELSTERSSDRHEEKKTTKSPKRKSTSTRENVKQVVRRNKTVEKESDEIPDKSINRHWISYQSNELIWKNSEGNTEILKEHVVNRTGNCQHMPICSHSNACDFLTWKNITFVLTDSAGMGKSTFITQVSNVIKNSNKSHWVIVVRINEGQIMDKLPEEVEFRHVLRMLRQYAGSESSVDETTVNTFLRNCVEHTGKLTVLVDGVDEVCPAHKVKALRVLEILQNTMEKNGGRLWVASRTVLKDDLVQIFHNATSLSLSPFSPQDQELYLFCRWSNSLKDWTYSDLVREIGELVTAIREATSSDGRSLCDVPLYTRMLADAYSGEEIDLLLKQKKVELASRFNRGALYKRFVEKTLGVVWAKAGISESAQLNLNINSQDVLQKHGLYAALECFHESTFLGKYYDEVMQAVIDLENVLEREKTARTGIITHIVDGRPKFLHYTLAEYLAAFWLQDKYSSLPQLTRALYEGLFGEVRYFFDALLAEGHTLHMAAMSGRLDTVRSALHLKGEKVEDEDRGGRRALHLATISGHTDIVRTLLEEGAKATTCDRVLGWTPLRYVDTMIRIPTEAIMSSAKTQSLPLLEIVELLLWASAKSKNAPRIFQEQNIFAAAIREDYPNVCKEFIKKAGWLFVQKWQKKSYMHLAAEHGSSNVLSMLLHLDFRVNVSSRAHRDGTPLHVAAREGHHDFCSNLLLHGAHVDNRDRDGYTALHEAARMNHQTVCEVLLQYRADPNVRNHEGETSLHQAAREGHVSLCRWLVENGSDINVEDNYGRTAAHEAARWGRQLVINDLLGVVDIEETSYHNSQMIWRHKKNIKLHTVIK